MQRLTWWKLSAVQIGGAVCLPVILVGQILGETYGWTAALISVLVGNSLLVAMGLAMSSMGIRYRESTMELSRRFFGEEGCKLFSLAFLVVTVGWFAIQLNLMGIATAKLADTLLGFKLPAWLWNVGLGLAITWCTRKGLASMSLLAAWSMPLLFATLGITAWHLRNEPAYEAVTGSGLGVSLIVATAIAAALDLPTYFKEARSNRDGLWAVIIGYGLALPVVELLGVYIGTKTPGLDLVAALTAKGGTLWIVWALMFMLLAGWTTNNGNLYSGGASLSTLRPRATLSQSTVAVGLMGVVLSCLPVLDHLPAVLSLLGIVVIALGSVMLVVYLLGTPETPGTTNAWCALLGTGVGIGAMNGWTISGAPVIDAGLVAASFASLGWRLSGRKKKCTN